MKETKLDQADIIDMDQLNGYSRLIMEAFTVIGVYLIGSLCISQMIFYLKKKWR